VESPKRKTLAGVATLEEELDELSLDEELDEELEELSLDEELEEELVEELDEGRDETSLEEALEEDALELEEEVTDEAEEEAVSFEEETAVELEEEEMPPQLVSKRNNPERTRKRWFIKSLQNPFNCVGEYEKRNGLGAQKDMKGETRRNLVAVWERKSRENAFFFPFLFRVIRYLSNKVKAYYRIHPATSLGGNFICPL
jgi:hypothetical protein